MNIAGIVKKEVEKCLMEDKQGNVKFSFRKNLE